MIPRINRLRKDYGKLKELADRSKFVSIDQMEGNPPEKYVLHLTCRGRKRVTLEGDPIFSDEFFLDINLHDEYPRKGPYFRVLADFTPVFHPNIAANGLVCYGDVADHGWSPDMRLDDVVVRIIKMIRYENVGLNSAFNFEAARWARENQHLFPLDTSQIMSEDDILDRIRIDEDCGADDDLLDDIVIWEL